jgi:GTP-binding protein HflX
MLEAEEVDTVIFDDELRPGQMRALEKALGSKVSLCDRTALILDIFGQRAASKEGQLQVSPHLSGSRCPFCPATSPPTPNMM